MNKFRIFLFYSGLVDIKAREGHDAVEGITNQLFVARYQLYLPKREELQAQLDKLLDEAE